MKSLTPYLSLLILFGLVACEENGAPDQDVAPSVTIIKPIADVQVGEKIPINIEFLDDKGLSHVEISLGSNENSGDVYHYLQRGLFGKEDQIQYTVDPPTSFDIIGSNYILITCRDNGGNVTIMDEDFMVVDGNPPSGSFVYTDSLLRRDPTGMAEVVYNAADNEGLKEISLELYKVDAQGEKIQLMDAVKHDAGGATTFQKQHFFSGKSSYATGDQFRFFIRILDESDNMTEVAADNIGWIIN